MKTEDLYTKDLALQYLLAIVGTPYKWGGSCPIYGIDCSGLAVEFLKAFHKDVPDMSAASLYSYTNKHVVPEAKFGTFIFFGKPNAITHVGIALSDSLMIEAAGGDSATTTPAIAASKSAFVKIRPIAHRKDKVAMCYPEYIWDK